MKTESKKLLKILFISIFFLINQHVLAIEFETEQEKGVWIKNFFKDKEFERQLNILTGCCTRFIYCSGLIYNRLNNLDE